MPVDLSPYRVAAGEKPASSSKQNNGLSAIQAALNAVPANQLVGYPADATKYLDGSGNWSQPGGPAYSQMAFQANNAAVNITATTQATANTLVTAPNFTADGLLYWVDYYCGRVSMDANQREIRFRLYVDGTGLIDCGSCGSAIGGGVTGALFFPVHIRVPITPSAGIRAVSMRAYMNGGAGTSIADGTYQQWIRILKER